VLYVVNLLCIVIIETLSVSACPGKFFRLLTAVIANYRAARMSNFKFETMEFSELTYFATN
jgi:hypothetical protein